MSLEISKNRKSQKYTRREQFMRVLWGIGKIVFRVTPRPCFAIRRQILRFYGAKIGENVNIYPSALVYFPWNLEIGDNSSIGEWALVYNLGIVKIGKLTTISQRVHLCAGTHNYRDSTMPLLKPPIRVGDEVWVCADAFIGPGVQLNDRSIIAAASVVVKDVPANTIVGGNPAKHLKDR